MIAHRLSTIQAADQIVVLKDGQVQAQGTQEQLLSSSPLYREMWNAHVGAKNWSATSGGNPDAMRQNQGKEMESHV